jgi:hypothetical protein
VPCSVEAPLLGAIEGEAEAVAAGEGSTVH